MDLLQELITSLKENGMTKEHNDLLQIIMLSKDELLSISNSIDEEMVNIIPTHQYDRLQNLMKIQQLVSSYSEYLEKLLPEQEASPDEDYMHYPRYKEFFSFSAIDLPIGSEIVFIDDKKIRPIVNGDKTVAFENKTWRLATLVRELKTRNGTNTQSGAYQGSCYFEYNGEKLFNIWQRKTRGK